MTNKYQICTRTVMDTSDPDITFDENGVCQYVDTVEKKLTNVRYTDDQVKENLNSIKQIIEKNTEKLEYNCLIGLSGGIDSSYVVYLAKQIGLRPLIVHFDNGWNSELSVKNIDLIIKKLGYNLITYVINWEEFRDLQVSFLKASVVDIEMLTDHAIAASMYKIAHQYKIPFVISGSNVATEGFMPPTWIWTKGDALNIKAIHKRFGNGKLKTFPFMGSLTLRLKTILGLNPTYLRILDNINYSQKMAISTLEKEFGWRYYGGKHYESVFTKFYQAYILPNKFNIDKRKVHYSSLILNNEMTRDEAINKLNKPLYNENDLRIEKEYVLKKLELSDEEFNKIMEMPPIPHDHYPTERRLMSLLVKIKRLFK